MTDFYTNFFSRGNYIYVKGIKDGKRYRDKVKYRPYLFVNSDEGTFRTINGKRVGRLDFSDIREARDFCEQYKDTNFNVYGLTNYQYTYIYDTYKNNPETNELEYDIEKIKVGSLDIECAADDGFPNIQLADKEITAITVRHKKKAYVFGCGQFETTDPDIYYIRCPDETILLTKFLKAWDFLDLDVVTGWNCIPKNQLVWGKTAISPISEIDDVYENAIVNKSPISEKEELKVTLSNGQSFIASGEHKLIVKSIPSDKYTKFTEGPKKQFKHKVITTEDAMNHDDCLFVECKLRQNDNLDQLYSDKQLYLAGLIYTDGSIKNKGVLHGYTISQSDKPMLEALKNEFNITTNIIGPYKNSYSLYVNETHISNARELIYNGEQKRLNIKEISKLSYSQFMMFLSGLLDGDGCYDGRYIQWCNYNDDLDALQQLLQWNGIFSIRQGNNIIRFIDYNFSDLSLRKHSRWYTEPVRPLKRNTSQEAGKIRFKRVGTSYWVKIKSIEKTGKVCQMMDIETTDHTFITNGVTVHNCEFFDIPYLFNRIRNLLGEDEAKKLSPFRMYQEKKTEFKGKEAQSYELAGIAILDYYHLYRKFTFTNHESYKLDFIAELELKEKKLDYSEYGSLLELYKNNFQKFIEYNILDTVLVDKLEDKLKFLELVFSFAYDAKVNYIDTLTTVRPWDIIIHNYLMDQRIVVPAIEDRSAMQPLVGGYVKDVKVGMSKWVVSFDYDSLYPHLIMAFNISPETFVRRDPFMDIEKLLEKPDFPKEDFCYAVNGCVYRKDKIGFLPSLMARMYNDRIKYKDLELEAKKEYENTKNPVTEKLIAKYHNFQWAKKIQLNSAYGALANIWFRWFNFNHAEAITTSGQFSTQWVGKHINILLNQLLETKDEDYIIASDTDSLYVTLEKCVDGMKGVKDEKEIVAGLDIFCKGVIQPFIGKTMVELAEYLNMFPGKLRMKRETIASKGIWTAKKKYILNAWNIEGVQFDKPKIKITGIEAVRSSTPKVCRDWIKGALELIMNENETSLHKYVSDCEKQHKSMPFKDIAIPSGVNGVKKYSDPKTLYGFKTPIHVKGALIFNSLVKKHNLRNIVPISDGDKIKYVHLSEPNPLHDIVIAAPDELPPEFGLEKYIDRRKMFDKTFIEPLSRITNVIGWTPKKVCSMLDFF